MLELATSFLRTALSDPARFAKGTRLPTTAHLARSAGVSLVTMAKALRVVAPEFGLVMSPGAGIRNGPPQSLPTEPRRGRAYHVQTRLMRDIADGHYRATGRLPGMKELAGRYGCGLRVLRRAVRALIEQGMITEYRRTLVLAKSKPYRLGSSIALVTGDDFANLINSSAYRNRVEVFTGVLEQECARRGIALARHVVSDERQAVACKAGSLGSLVYLTSALHPFRTALVRVLASGARPVALFNDVAVDAFAESGPATLSTFELDDEQAGFDAGRELLCLGHRTVCYIGLAQAEFSDLRLAGLRRAFGSAGLHNSIHVLKRNRAGGDTALAHPRPNARDRAELVQTERHIDAWMSLGEQLNSAHLPAEGRRIAAHLLVQHLGFECYRRDLVVLMRTALGISGLTAIVSADDNIALHGVMPFLCRTGVRVPADLSLVSFNGSFEASQAGLTSYQFDIGGTAVRMLDRVLTPHRGRPVAGNHRRSAVTGVLIRRDSLGAAHTQE